MKNLICLIFLGILCAGMPIFGQKKQQTAELKTIYSRQGVETLEQQIWRIARGFGLDVRLFQSLIYAESTFNPRALSPKGAGCYTQLMPATARRFGLRVDSLVDERFSSNPEKCLTAGAQYLAWLLQTFRGDVRLALAGYNAGEGAVMRFGWRIPPFKETVQYVEKICALYYGQSGHGVAMAYNQQLAQYWVGDLYAKWKRGRGASRLLQNTALVQPLNSADNSQSEQTSGNVQNTQNAVSSSSSSPKQTEIKKPVLTRVVLTEDASPRIRTQSLSFR